MCDFESWQSYSAFAYSVMRESRYIYDAQTRKFLDTVLMTSSKRKLEIPSESFFWRAQQGFVWQTINQDGEEFDVPAPFMPERMKPLPNAAREGRVNPKGIPCLYLADNQETALAEVRPWVGSLVSIGRFQILKSLLLVDCSIKDEDTFRIYFAEPDAPERENAVWSEINGAFSKPINADDTTADYAPTQILAETFRSHGYDGLAYKSALGRGFNIALFDMNVAKLVGCSLYEVKKVSFEFSQASNSYVINSQDSKP